MPEICNAGSHGGIVYGNRLCVMPNDYLWLRRHLDYPRYCPDNRGFIGRYCPCNIPGRSRRNYYRKYDRNWPYPPGHFCSFPISGVFGDRTFTRPALVYPEFCGPFGLTALPPSFHRSNHPHSLPRHMAIRPCEIHFCDPAPVWLPVWGAIRGHDRASGCAVSYCGAFHVIHPPAFLGSVFR